MYYAHDPFAFLIYWNATKWLAFFTYRVSYSLHPAAGCLCLKDKIGVTAVSQLGPCLALMALSKKSCC